MQQTVTLTPPRAAAPPDIDVHDIRDAADAGFSRAPRTLRTLAGARPRVVFAANTAWYLHNYYRNTLAAFRDAGWDVHVLCPGDANSRKLEALGCRHTELPLIPSSKNPFREARALTTFLRVYRALRPQVAFHFTVKCNLYGGFAASRLGIPHANNVAGLGSAFGREGWLNTAVGLVYGLTQRRSGRVFFQNPADMEFMRARGLVRDDQAVLLPGSGVDLEHFRPRPFVPARERLATGAEAAPGFRFVFAGRLLREKGLAELAEAMRSLRARGDDAHCDVYGFLDARDARYVTRAELAAWETEGLLRYAGPLEDVRAAYDTADCVVLPTYYREGIPKSLLEAAAMGKPLITTDQTGCREAVLDEYNGFLCKPRDARELALAMARMRDASPEARARLGANGRRLVESRFSEAHIIGKYLDAARLLANHTLSASATLTSAG